jgi:hypothetical protein
VGAGVRRGGGSRLLREVWVRGSPPDDGRQTAMFFKLESQTNTKQVNHKTS